MMHGQKNIKKEISMSHIKYVVITLYWLLPNSNFFANVFMLLFFRKIILQTKFLFQQTSSTRAWQIWLVTLNLQRSGSHKFFVVLVIFVQKQMDPTRVVGATRTARFKLSTCIRAQRLFLGFALLATKSYKTAHILIQVYKLQNMF